MDLTLAITLGVFLILFFGTSCFGLYVWLKKSIYTREKFAFVGLASALTLTLFVIASIFAQEPPWLAVIGLSKQLLGLPYQPPQTLTIEQEILSIILVIGLWWLIVQLHRNWSGAQSNNHYEQQQKQQTPSLILDSALLLHPTQNRNLLEIYHPESQFHLSALEGAEESLVWREQARELLLLSDRKYDFPLSEWHDQMHCWVGTHKGTGDVVILACQESQPDMIKLQTLTIYADKVRQNNGQNNFGMEFIIAVKDGDVDEITQLEGFNFRTVSESCLLDGLVDFGDYFYDLQKRVEKNTLTGSNLTLNDVYTVSRFKLEKEGSSQVDLEGFLNAWLDEPMRCLVSMVKGKALLL